MCQEKIGTYSSQHNGAFFSSSSFARTPVWGHASKPQQEALVQEKNDPTKGVNRNSSKLFKKAPSPLGVTMKGRWPLFIPAHSACSLIPLLRVVRSVGML